MVWGIKNNKEEEEEFKKQSHKVGPTAYQGGISKEQLEDERRSEANKAANRILEGLGEYSEVMSPVLNGVTEKIFNEDKRVDVFSKENKDQTSKIKSNLDKMEEDSLDIAQLIQDRMNKEIYIDEDTRKILSEEIKKEIIKTLKEEYKSLINASLSKSIEPVAEKAMNEIEKHKGNIIDRINKLSKDISKGEALIPVLEEKKEGVLKDITSIQDNILGIKNNTIELKEVTKKKSHTKKSESLKQEGYDI